MSAMNLASLRSELFPDDPMPVPNVELLRLVMKQIEAEPKRWRQGAWAMRLAGLQPTAECGTAFCAAGWAVQLTGGYEFKFENAAGSNPYGEKYQVAEYCAPVDSPDQQVYIENVAKELLGLTDDEAQEFFAAENDLDDLQMLAEGIAARAG